MVGCLTHNLGGRQNFYGTQSVTRPNALVETASVDPKHLEVYLVTPA